MDALRRWAGLISALLVALMGIALVGLSLFVGTDMGGGGVAISDGDEIGPRHFLGFGLLFVGGFAAFYQIRKLYQARQDPYDLSRLWEEAPAPIPEPDEDAIDDDGTLLCHACGHAVPPPYTRCPECGRSLG